MARAEQRLRFQPRQSLADRSDRGRRRPAAADQRKPRSPNNFRNKPNLRNRKMPSSKKFPVDATEAEVRSAAAIRTPGSNEVIRYTLAIELRSMAVDPFARGAIADALHALESLGVIVRDCSYTVPSKAVPSPESIARTIKQSRKVADVARRSASSRAAAARVLSSIQHADR